MKNISLVCTWKINDHAQQVSCPVLRSTLCAMPVLYSPYCVGVIGSFVTRCCDWLKNFKRKPVNVVAVIVFVL